MKVQQISSLEDSIIQADERQRRVLLMINGDKLILTRDILSQLTTHLIVLNFVYKFDLDGLTRFTIEPRVIFFIITVDIKLKDNTTMAVINTNFKKVVPMMRTWR